MEPLRYSQRSSWFENCTRMLLTDVVGGSHASGNRSLYLVSRWLTPDMAVTYFLVLVVDTLS
jgi:hypothetical protein